MSTADPLVTVCRDPKDRERARVRLSALDGFAFDVLSDGARSRFSRAMLVAYLDPTDIVEGELRRPASHGPAPDRVKVAITRTWNQSTYPIMERMAAAARIASLAPVARQRVRLDAPAIPTRAPVARPPVAAEVMMRPRAPKLPKLPKPPKPPKVDEVVKADEVVAMRVRTGLSRPEFAARFGVEYATLYTWETGRRLPRATARAVLNRAEKTLHPGATQHSG